MPLAATLHLDVLGLFHNIWANPDTTVHDMVKYILKMSDKKSVTWAAHVKILCEMYCLPDPLALLEKEDAWPKSVWKGWCQTKIRAFHEKLWRSKALRNSKMTYLNVQLSGLTGQHHPALYGILTTRDVERLRPHIKMLAGDYLTYSRMVLDRKGEGDPSCRMCSNSHSPQPVASETLEHILTECIGTAEVRERLFPELLNTLLSVEPDHPFLSLPPKLHTLDITLTQFILDCTSFNLPETIRVNQSNSRLPDIFRFSRDFCYAIHGRRMSILKTLT